MNYKELKWRQYKNEYRADIRLKGLFGIRFTYGKTYNDKYFYQWIINGKKYGGNYYDEYPEFSCKSLKQSKKLCEEKYLDICIKIEDTIYDE